ncbi:serine/threonine-protein kinase [Actinoallomurus sp. CA-142502]|uniref:serine/threonine-protein kinase n=1 Tax=Actinoallomurus sp. CA-142502 TaxID=3239885 RepID=UPI003D92BB93
MELRSEDLPEAIGKYRPQSHLAAGGMGRVFLALDPEGRTVALKQLHPSIAYDDGMRERLRREVAAMRRIRSPRVAQLIDADLDVVPPYLVTGYVQGRTLHDVVKSDGPLRGDRLRRIARGVAEALVAIHAAGHVHRDLKPANVMVVDDDPVVIDFGIAQEHDATRITQDGGAIGTLGYMAPEVLEGGTAGPPADIFAWGATVAYAATGRPAFGGGGVQAVALRTYRGAADLDGVPDELRPLLSAALAPAAEARPDANTVLGAMAAPTGPTSFFPAYAAPAPPAAPVRRNGRRRSAIVIPLSAVVMVAVVILAIVALRPNGKGSPKAPAATRTVVTSQPRPSYREPIANWGPGQKFQKFLEANNGKRVYILADLDEAIVPQDGQGQPYDASHAEDGATFTLWTSCTEKLAAGEEPTSDKCAAILVEILPESAAWSGFSWVHGAYKVQGNFEIAEGAVHQGVAPFTLKPAPAA